MARRQTDYSNRSIATSEPKESKRVGALHKKQHQHRIKNSGLGDSLFFPGRYGAFFALFQCLKRAPHPYRF
ncbi:hypothetical protein MARHY3354 [Marinobacter nauticus ATCC 49840]|nr:hypothetical protein MARHY3354 [Marinobacter nauticus ATCC 49840]